MLAVVLDPRHEGSIISESLLDSLFECGWHQDYRSVRFCVRQILRSRLGRKSAQISTMLIVDFDHHWRI